MKIKKILPQLITLLVVVLIFGFFTFNAQVNMENRGIEFGYGFLSQESSFDVQFSLIEYDGSHSYFRAYLVGLLNTILVSVIGIIFATIIPIIVANIIPIKATNRVFNRPTKYALAYEWDPSYSIKENWTSKEDSWDKKP